MEFYHIALLALVQGIAEFLPISSSGHLILLHNLMDPEVLKNAADNRLMDIAVHIGTLAAVLAYFHKDVWRMIRGTLELRGYKTRGLTPDSKLMIHVVIGSLPILFVGALVYTLVDPSFFYNPKIIFFTTIIFGVLLWYADKISPKTRKVENLTVRDSLMIGFAQCLALIPGTSRSGITMTTARFLSMERTEAARYSILLSIIATAAVGAAGIFDIIREGNDGLISDALLAACLTFVIAIAVITFLMQWFRRFGMMPFMIYRLLLGAAIFYFYIWPDL